MKDFLGNEVGVGDKVACIELGYKNLVYGEIIKITPKAMRIAFKSGWRSGDAILRYSDQVIKIPNK